VQDDDGGVKGTRAIAAALFPRRVGVGGVHGMRGHGHGHSEGRQEESADWSNVGVAGTWCALGEDAGVRSWTR